MMFPNFKLKNENFQFKEVNRILFIIVIIIYVFALSVYGYWDYSYQKNIIIRNIDKELYNSAVTLKYILPEDFHDRAIEDQSIPVSEDKYIALKLTGFVKETGFKYAYTIIKKEGNLFFITSDLVADPQTQRGTFYYYPYEDADISFFEAFDKKVPTYRTVSDQWGTVRTVMVPEKSPGGVKYLSCVDYDISYVEEVLRKNLIRSITTLLFFLSLSIPIIFIYLKLHRNYLNSLRKSEEKYRRIFENSVVGFFQSTPEGRFISVNTAFARMLHYDSPEEVVSEISDINTQYYVDVEDRRRYQRILQEQGYVENYDVQVKRKDGTRIWVSSSTRAYFDDEGSVLHYEGINVDITFRKRAEKEREALREQLQQSQKFEAIGTLAGGVAHDFNNILMGIQGRASLLGVEMNPDQRQGKHIAAIENYVQSATHLTRQLLGFARGGKYEVQPVDVNNLLTDSADMFGRTHKEIRIHMRLNESHLTVEVDKRQIEQVLLNIFVNAWQAMPNGGDLYIETGMIDVDKSDRRTHRIEPGRFVKISVTDTGIGMDEGTRQQIFDPFFTTKDKSRGTGLGLASAYGIISNHGGTITVYSRIGHGATFNIYLPASTKKANRDVAERATLQRGSESILLVDDEKMIREVGRGMLENLGYRVRTAASGEEAVEAVQQSGETLNLVILDMIMPGIGGSQTFDQIRAMRPQLPILLSSGYAINGQASEIMNKGCDGFIQKPFNISEFSLKIRQILDAIDRTSADG